MSSKTRSVFSFAVTKEGFLLLFYSFPLDIPSASVLSIRTEAVAFSIGCTDTAARMNRSLLRRPENYRLPNVFLYYTALITNRQLSRLLRLCVQPPRRFGLCLVSCRSGRTSFSFHFQLLLENSNLKKLRNFQPEVVKNLYVTLYLRKVREVLTGILAEDTQISYQILTHISSHE